MTDETLAGVVERNAARDPTGVAFAGAGTLTWREYHERAGEIGRALADRHPPGSRVAVQMADGPDVHLLYLALERAGLVTVGIGPRAGERERGHLLERTGAVELLQELPSVGSAPVLDDERAFGPDELWFLNSTSGTTGLPKCVMHHQRRWFAFHELAVDAGALTPDDVFMSVLPAPFGFGLWTAHFTPAILGAPCVVLESFTPEATLAAIAEHRVTVLAAVSTQFVMMLRSAAIDAVDLSSLRVMFTGGEMVPFERAVEFEARAGCRVLQFYGSNETGALSRTTLRDDQHVRLRTAGHVIESMQVRLLDPETAADITASGGPGVGACKGALNCLGYYEDDVANAELLTPDGWMRTGDLCTIDAAGVLTVSGRTSDIVIRGGKNISASQVEDEVGSHPAVALCAAVAMPDATFGERVCVYVVLRESTARDDDFDLDVLRAHLQARGTGKELWPEALVLVEGDLPRSSGGKVAKAALRDDAARRAAATTSPGAG